MANSLFKFSAVKAQHASPATIRQAIESVLTANDDACADRILQYMTPPGRMGSKEYDHCMAVNVVLDYDQDKDKDGRGLITEAMKASDMSPRMLWDQLVTVYRNAGFQIKHGRVVGILEDQSQDNNDSREDSVD